MKFSIDVGKQLKSRRYFDDMEVMESYLPEDHDEEVISKTSEEVKDVLAANDKEAETNMSKLINQYAEKQVEINEQVSRTVSSI